jgi:hypothetical protein
LVGATEADCEATGLGGGVVPGFGTALLVEGTIGSGGGAAALSTGSDHGPVTVGVRPCSLDFEPAICEQLLFPSIDPAGLTHLGRRAIRNGKTGNGIVLAGRTARRRALSSLPLSIWNAKSQVIGRKGV